MGVVVKCFQNRNYKLGCDTDALLVGTVSGISPQKNKKSPLKNHLNHLPNYELFKIRQKRTH
jgi:hypothetical protein